MLNINAKPELRGLQHRRTRRRQQFKRNDAGLPKGLLVSLERDEVLKYAIDALIEIISIIILYS